MKQYEYLKAVLDSSLSTGKYSQVFLEDVLNLWWVKKISPEVILREIRALEGLEIPVLDVEGEDRIRVWPVIRGADPTSPPITYSRNVSSTKEATQFHKKSSPLNGMWHKHYFINQDDFLEANIRNQRKKYMDDALPPVMAMITKIIEGSITGEWIIFRKDDQNNEYLCLAKHNDGDDVIFDRLKNL